MEFQVTQEKRKEIERIQREYASELSPTVILRSTAQAINGVLSRSIPRINKRVKEKYNISQKYLSRRLQVSPKANANTLWGGITVNDSNLPVNAFRPKQQGSSISVAFKKGKTVYIQNSFIATMDSGYTGVFSRGHYEKQGFVSGREKTSTGKIQITEIQTSSVFGMSINDEVVSDVQGFMGTEVIARVHGILSSRVDKLKK